MKDLQSKCWLIKNIFKFDVEAIDNQLKTILHISEDNEPLVITEARKNSYPDLQNALKEVNKHSFCFHTDSFHLSYIAVAINEDGQYKGMVIFGPFIYEQVTDAFIWKVMKDNRLDNSWFKPLENYYKKLTYEGDRFVLGDVLVTILVSPRIYPQLITTKSSEASKLTKVEPQELDEDGMDIKLRYKAEKKYLHFVEIGDKAKALEALVEFTGDFLYRVPGNPLRARKNLSFCSNTLNRIAALKGGVAPQYLHAISEKFSIKIEQAVTLSELDALQISMAEEYCDAVRNFAIKGHSSVVKDALLFINLHYNEPINLQVVSDEIGFNRTYVAKKFREEMGMSVVDYIQKKRIDEAVFLMEQGLMSITDIGIQVGFSSYNYFCKVFKDVKGKTATEYLKSTRADV
ncbi:MAG: AraC family transcriptional regulator [Bacillota bacterium]|nr:AraC family transcriptional regulator [Bacillota bacterium]